MSIQVWFSILNNRRIKAGSVLIVVYCLKFLLLLPSEVIIIVIELMFLGVNMFLALLRAHFSPCLRLGLKWAWSRAKNIFTPANINSIVIITYLLQGFMNDKDRSKPNLDRDLKNIGLHGDKAFWLLNFDRYPQNCLVHVINWFKTLLLWYYQYHYRLGLTSGNGDNVISFVGEWNVN